MSVSSVASAPTSSPTPPSRPASSTESTSASNGSGTQATGRPEESSSSTSTTESSTTESSASPGVVSDVVQVDGPEEVPNPYSEFAPHAERVTAESWTRDRTAGPGQVSRDDHLIGMLENRGFSSEEIYARDEQGRTLIDRVAEANNLSNPNLIHAGESYIIPSRNEPAHGEARAEALAEGLESAYALAETDLDLGDLDSQRASARAQADAQAEENAVASAASSLSAGDVNDSMVTSEAEANAVSTDANAAAVATADLDVENASNSVLAASAQADAQAQENAAASAASRVSAAEVSDSTVTSEAQSNAVSTDGNAAAVSTADLDVENASNSVLAASAQADAQAQENASSYAESTVQVGALEDSRVTSEAVATSETEDSETPQTARAATAVEAESAENLDVRDVAETGPDGPSASQELSVDNGPGRLEIDQTAEVGDDGSSDQRIDLGGEGEIAIHQTSDAQNAASAVVNHDNYGSPFTGTNYSEADQSTAEVVNTGSGGHVAQEVQGIRNASLNAGQADYAIMETDAQFASYEARAGEGLRAVHEGRNGTVDIGVNSDDRVYFRDGAESGPMMHTPTGNTINGTVAGGDIRLQLGQSQDVAVNLEGTQTDNRIEVQLPNSPMQDTTQDHLGVNLRNGTDYLVTTGGSPSMVVDKPEGDLNLHMGEFAHNASPALGFEIGDSNLRGHVNLRGTQDATVAINSNGGAEHDATFYGGAGSTMVINLTGDELPPQVVVDQGGIWPWSSGPTGILPEEHSGTIQAPGFERVVMLRDGQLEAAFGEGAVDEQTLEQLRAALAEQGVAQ